MSTIAAINVANGEIIGTSVSAIVTIPATIKRFQIAQASIVNSGSTPVTVNIYVLQNGDTVIDTNKSVVNKTLGAGETYLLFEMINMSIDAGGTIQAFVDTGADTSMFVTGTEFTT